MTDHDAGRMLVRSLSTFIVEALIGEPSQVAVLACVDAAVKLIGRQNPHMSTLEAVQALRLLLGEQAEREKPTEPDDAERPHPDRCHHDRDRDTCEECKAELVKGGIP